MKNCPMCGVPVRIHSSDEGTNSYVPLEDEKDERIEELEAVAEEAFVIADYLLAEGADTVVPHARIVSFHAALARLDGEEK